MLLLANLPGLGLTISKFKDSSFIKEHTESQTSPSPFTPLVLLQGGAPSHRARRHFGSERRSDLVRPYAFLASSSQVVRLVVLTIVTMVIQRLDLGTRHHSAIVE